MSDPLPVVLATGNAGKAREFDRLMAPSMSVRPLPAGVKLPPETGQTFYQNACSKAEAVFEALGGVSAVLADDSGLEVKVLGGRPGLQSARFAGEGASDADNVAKLLHELNGCDERAARFVCSLVLLLPGDSEGAAARRELAVEGYSRGTITLVPLGDDGFGYDPVFQPDGWGMTLAEAAPADKDRVSHRGAAVRALLCAVADLDRSGEA